MVKIRDKGQPVDVYDRDCPKRPCYWVGRDKGSYSPGRGYSYHRDRRGKTVERLVCWTRHLHGCPLPSVCPQCRTLAVQEPGTLCPGCQVPRVAYPLCTAPAVSKEEA